MRMLLKHVLICLAILALSSPTVISNDNPDEREKEALKKTVERILRLPNVDRREYVNVIFRLADVLAMEGDYKGAKKYYSEGLKLDSWRFDYQLKLARVLKETDGTKEALEKARIVYDLAKKETLVFEAREFLLSLNADPDEKRVSKDNGDNVETCGNVEIVIVNIGKTDRHVIGEIKDQLQEMMGIKYSLSSIAINPKEYGRVISRGALPFLVRFIENNISNDDFENLLANNNMTGEDLSDKDNVLAFIQSAREFLEGNGSLDEKKNRVYGNARTIIEIVDAALELKDWHFQYFAEDLLRDIETFSLTEKVRGYLGITSEDLTVGDYNYVFGWAGRGAGVMSYYRFTAEPYEVAIDRQKLVDRAVKQAVSSSFWILGIPRCSSPDCARAYPQSLREHDRKPKKLCSWCRESLEKVISDDAGCPSKERDPPSESKRSDER